MSAYHRAIILDFDGIIIESNEIKDAAFDQIFSKFPKHYDEIMRYHKAHNALVRYDKFSYISREIMRLTEDQALPLITEWSDQFKEFTRRELLGCAYVEGALAFLDFFHTKTSLYLASMTPQAELDWITDQRGVKKYFKSVHGGPEKKTAMFSRILKESNLNVKDAIFIGDSDEDWASAREAGITFIGRRGRSSFEGASFPVYKDMKEIQRHLITEYGQ